MNRPYIFCHMMTSLDGKITGNFMQTSQSDEAGDVFYDIAFGKNAHYKHQGWLSGRVTTDENFTFYNKPELKENEEKVPDGDYIVKPLSSMYYVSVDPNGKLGWKENTLTYVDTTASILEILTEKASNEYKAFLRRKNISYIIAGNDQLDYKMAMEKLYRLFNIETLMLGGGGVLNWTFIQAQMCDELSLVIAPVADGSNETPTLFEVRNNLGNTTPVGFELTHAEVVKNNVVWLRYKIAKEMEEK